MNFDAQTALDYAASIARPRRVGSGEDEKVAQEIVEKLRGWGYHVEQQPFTFSTAPQVFLTLVVLGGMLLVIVMLATHEWLLAVADFAALALILVFVLFMPLNRVVQLRALEKNGQGLKRGWLYTTANLIATLPQATDPTAPHLFLVAHYDSKSQRLPLAVRMTLFMLAIITGLILAVLTLLNISTALYLPIGLLVLAAGLPLLFLDVGNDSPGAVDNASSVGLVLHLAEILAQDAGSLQGAPCRHVTILLPGAEELTLMGSVAYVIDHQTALRQQAQQGGLYILNFDGIGVDGDLYFVGHSHSAANGDRNSLLEHVRTACAELRVPLKKFRIAGALFDHIPFAQRGFDAISLVAVGKGSRLVHTRQDSIDQLHVHGFEQAGRVALRVIRQITG